MPIMRVTFIFKLRNAGWTETIYNAEGTYDGVGAIADRLAPMRCRLLGTDAQLQNLRVSDDEVFRDSLPLLPPTLNVGPTINGPADPKNTCLNIRLAAGTLHRRTLQIRGIPDQYIVAGAFAPDANYLSALNTFMRALAQAPNLWSLKVPDPLTTAEFNITAATLFGVITAPGPNYPTGTRVVIRGAKGLRRIRGTWVVTNMGADQYSLAGYRTNTADPAYNGGGKIRRDDPELQGITQAIKGGVSSRRTGRPSDSPVGRRKIFR